MSLKFKPRDVVDAVLLDYSPGPGSYRGSGPVGPAGYWNRNVDGSYSLNPLYRPPTVSRSAKTVPARTGSGFRIVPSSRNNTYAPGQTMRPRPSLAASVARAVLKELNPANDVMDALQFWDTILNPGGLFAGQQGWIKHDGTLFNTADIVDCGLRSFQPNPPSRVQDFYGSSWLIGFASCTGSVLSSNFSHPAWTGVNQGRSNTGHNVRVVYQRGTNFTQGGTPVFNYAYRMQFRYPELTGAATGANPGTFALPTFGTYRVHKPFPRPVPLPIGPDAPGNLRPGRPVVVPSRPTWGLHGPSDGRNGPDLHNPPAARPRPRNPVTGVGVIIGGGGGGGTRVVAPLPRRPPPRGTKEKKAGVNGVAYRILRAALAVTEGLDLLDAIWNALPDHMQTGRSPQAKIADIWNNLGSLDMTDVVLNIVKNDLEDRVIGGINARAGDAFRELTGRPQSIWFQGG